MQISLNLTAIGDNKNPKKGLCSRAKASICSISLWNCLFSLVIFVTFSVVLYVSKSYTSTLLFWLEKQDAAIIYALIIVLFIAVSFPVCVGYIIIVIATGYLFGVLVGLFLSVIGANIGLLIAHNVLRLFGHHSSIRTFIASEMATAIFRVITGPACFKIVLCARLTPIPFGLQNTIFALSNISSKLYYITSLLGLLPGQLVGVYVGSSLRSMQDVVNDKPISSFTYFFATIQLVFAAGLLLWLGSKARRELTRALAEAEGKHNIGNSKNGYSIV